MFLGAARAEADLLVVENGTPDVLRYTDAGTLAGSTAANLNSPIGINVNPAGNVFVVNADSVSQYSPTLAPQGYYLPTGTVNLAGPIDIAFDSAGNSYVTNQNSGSPFISSYTPAGANRGFFGTGTTGGLPNTDVPTGIGYDPVSHELYIANSGNNTFTIYNPANLSAPVAVINPTGAGALDSPQQIAFDSAGNVYIASFGAATGVASVKEYTASGTYIQTFTPTGALNGGAEGVAVDPSGNVYVSLLNRGTVEKFSPAGADLGPFASGLNSPAFLQYVTPSASAVPEPAGLLMAGMGLAFVGGARLYRRKRHTA